MKGHHLILIGLAVLLIAIMARCGNSSSSDSSSIEYTKSPIDILVRDLSNESNFSIILYDMDYNESNEKYKHQYKVIKFREQPTDTAIEEITGWKDVSEELFQQHINDMGMEVASKKDGVVEKETAPPGYKNYVGNEKYGHWTTNSSGGSFWEFYGRYAFMSSMFNLATMPIRYSMYDDYYNNYRGTSRSFYGSNGNGNYYGTNSKYSSNNTSTWNSKPQTFKDKVRSRVSQSSSSQFSNSTSSSTTPKTTRSSGRSFSSSSFRGRSGGFGK